MDAVTGQPPEMLGDIRVVAASEVLAGRLRERILSGQLADGTRLPVERELVRTTGLSRTVVRDALKILAQEELVRTRAGRNGGSVVTRPTPRSIVRSVDHYAQAGRVSIDALLEARRLIEPLGAGLAARRRGPTALAAVEEEHRRLGAAVSDPSAFDAANLRWHVAIAHAGGNEFLASVVEGIVGVRKAGTEGRDLPARGRRAVIAAHETVMTAIRAQDGDAAERRMRRHLAAFEEWLMRPAQAPRAGSRVRRAPAGPGRRP